MTATAEARIYDAGGHFVGDSWRGDRAGRGV